MKKQAFNAGQPHQAAVATWARKRLVDRGGARFDDDTGQDMPKQIGCLFADGVGLGKTWEALATIAIGRCLRVDPANPNKRARVIDFVRTDDEDGEFPNADQERRDWLHQLSLCRRETTNGT